MAINGKIIDAGNEDEGYGPEMAFTILGDNFTCRLGNGQGLFLVKGGVRWFVTPNMIYRYLSRDVKIEAPGTASTKEACARLPEIDAEYRRLTRSRKLDDATPYHKGDFA